MYLPSRSVVRERRLRTSLHFIGVFPPALGLLRGVASALDFVGIMGTFSVSAAFDEDEIDARALYHDWSMVGSDLHNAMRTYEKAGDNEGARDYEQLELSIT